MFRPAWPQVVAVALLATGALLHGPASAGGINFLSGGCGLDVVGGSAADMALWACNTNAGSAISGLVGSVILSAPMPQFIACATEIEIKNSAGPIPAWWTPACRPGALVSTFDPAMFPIASSCPEIWSHERTPSQSPISVSNWYGPGEVTISSGTLVGTDQSIFAAGGVLSTADAQNLPADGMELAVFELRVTRAKSTGTGSCDGCATGVEISMHALWITDANGGTFVYHPETGNSVCVLAQSAPWGPCSHYIGAAKQSTWGAVKAQYR